MGFFSKILSVAAPIVGGAIGGPAGAAIGSGIGGALSTQDSQDFSAKSAANANSFTKEQLQNRHQWEQADLRKAGLNPILSAMKGAPSIGGSAQASNTTNVADATSKTSAASLGQQRLKAEIGLLNAQSQNQLSSAKAANANANLINTTNTQKARFSPIYKDIGNISSSASQASKDLFSDKAFYRPKNIKKFYKSAKRKLKND